MAESDLIIYLIVREDLKMGKGKIAAQCGHAVQDLIQSAPKNLLISYKKGYHTKICLKVKNFNEMEELRIWCKENKIPHYQVIDVGRTQVDPDTETVLGIGPVYKHIASKVLKNLKLL